MGGYCVCFVTLHTHYRILLDTMVIFRLTLKGQLWREKVNLSTVCSLVFVLTVWLTVYHYGTTDTFI